MQQYTTRLNKFIMAELITLWTVGMTAYWSTLLAISDFLSTASKSVLEVGFAVVAALLLMWFAWWMVKQRDHDHEAEIARYARREEYLQHRIEKLEKEIKRLQELEK